MGIQKYLCGNGNRCEVMPENIKFMNAIKSFE